MENPKQLRREALMMSERWLLVADSIGKDAVESVLHREMTEEERYIVLLAVKAMVDHTLLVPIPSFAEQAQ